MIKNIWDYSFDDGTYSHAFFIPIISAYLYYTLFTHHQLILRERLNSLALVLLIVTTLLLNFFIYAQFPFAYRILILVVITSAIAAAFKANWKVLFPSLFLIFLLPIWGVLTPYLQNLSTYIVTQLMRITHIPTYVDGNLIAIPEGVFEIAGGCSGLRYLIVSLTISSLFTFLNFTKIKQGIIFIIIAIIGALIVNWIRILILIFVGHYTNMESDLMQDHNMLGWYLYIPFMFLLFHIGHKLTEKNTPQNTANIKHNYKTVHHYYYNLTIIITIIISVAFLSQSWVSTQTPDTKLLAQQCETIPKSTPLPTIYNANLQCAYTADSTTVVTYYFDPLKLDSKPDFYLNTLAVDSASVITTYNLPAWQVNIIYDNKHYYLSAVSLITGKQRTASTAAYKTLKLANIIQGKLPSKLQWVVKKCLTNCQKEQQNFITFVAELPY